MVDLRPISQKIVLLTTQIMIFNFSSRIIHPIGIDTDTPSRSPFEDEMPSPEASNLMTLISPSPESPSSEDLLDGSFRTRYLI